jgi:hypothetical protein
MLSVNLILLFVLLIMVCAESAVIRKVPSFSESEMSKCKGNTKLIKIIRQYSGGKLIRIQYVCQRKQSSATTSAPGAGDTATEPTTVASEETTAETPAP